MQETILWRTRQEAKFIISLSRQKREIKDKIISKRKIFSIIGWDVTKNYWLHAPIFQRLVEARVFICVNRENGHNFYRVDFDRLDEIMDEDQEVKDFRKIGWCGTIPDIIK